MSLMTEEVNIAIKPEFTDVYCWELLPTESSIELIIKMPSGFDHSLMEIELN